MTVIVNGTELTLEPEIALQMLLEREGWLKGRIAVEVNRQLVPKAEWPRHKLKAGDRVEVVSFVGGG